MKCRKLYKIECFVNKRFPLVAICRKPCEPGYSCTSPDECTPDPNFVGKLVPILKT